MTIPPACTRLSLALAGALLLLAPDSYAEPNSSSSEFRVGLATGADFTLEHEDGAAFALSGMFLFPLDGNWVFGPTLQHAPAIFGGTSTHGGVAFGNAGQSNRYVQWLVEAGIHHVSGVGESLFTTSDAEPVDLPYVGANLRWVFDIGAPEGLVFDLSLAVRRDIGQSTQKASTKSCLLECVREERDFVVGGYHVVGGFGFGYQFSE